MPHFTLSPQIGIYSTSVLSYMWACLLLTRAVEEFIPSGKLDAYRVIIA